MLGVGETELALILVFAFVIFGPDKLPAMGRTLGRALKQFKSAQDGFTQVVQKEIMDPASAELRRDAKRSTVDAADDQSAGRTVTGKESFAARKQRLAKERAKAEAQQKSAAHQASETQEVSEAQPGTETVISEKPSITSSVQASTITTDQVSSKADQASIKPSVKDLYSMKGHAQAPVKLMDESEQHTTTSGEEAGQKA